MWLERACEDISGTWSTNSKSCFKSEENAKTHSESEMACRESAKSLTIPFRGRLAIILTREVYDKVILLTKRGKRYYVGAQADPNDYSQQFNASKWKWIDGDEVVTSLSGNFLPSGIKIDGSHY